MNQYIINPVSFERINKFKKLKYLYIKFFDFENIFVITLNTLKLLSINACKNVCLDSKIPYEILEVLEYNNTNNTIEYIFKNPNIYTFKNLIILNLSDNQLSKFDIDELGKVDCQELEVLNLSYNYLDDNKILKKLEKIKFKQLKELNLSNNEIIEIDFLERIDFKDLEILNLSCNEINDLSIFDKVKFKQLKELNLSNNKLSDSIGLNLWDFKDLEVLNLSHNELQDIEIFLYHLQLKQLTELDLSFNNIEEAYSLRNVDFKKIKKINLRNKLLDLNYYDELYDDDISFIKSILKNDNFIKLKELDLRENKISSYDRFLEDLELLKEYEKKNVLFDRKDTIKK